MVLRKKTRKTDTDSANKTTEYSAEHYHRNRSSIKRKSTSSAFRKIVGYRKAMTLPKMPKKMVVAKSGAIG